MVRGGGQSMKLSRTCAARSRSRKFLLRISRNSFRVYIESTKSGSVIGGGRLSSAV